MLHSSEPWAWRTIDCIEKLHVYACKRFLNVSYNATLSYKMFVNFDNLVYREWVVDLRLNVHQNGFGYTWETQEAVNHKSFLLEYVQKLKVQYIQVRKSKCSNSGKLHSLQ